MGIFRGCVQENNVYFYSLVYNNKKITSKQFFSRQGVLVVYIRQILTVVQNYFEVLGLNLVLKTLKRINGILDKTKLKSPLILWNFVIQCVELF